MPTGWGEMPPDALATINNFARQRIHDKNLKYDHAFMRIGEKPGTCPYVLVQSLPTPPGEATYDDIERSLRSFGSGVKQVQGSFADVARGMSIGDVRLDRANNRVTARVEMEVSGVGKVQGISFGFIGSKHIVFLHCYDHEDDFERRVPLFLKVADTFKFEPGHEFVAAQPKRQFHGVFSGVLPAAIIGAGIGGFVGLAVVLIRFLTKKPTEEVIDLAPYQDDD